MELEPEAPKIGQLEFGLEYDRYRHRYVSNQVFEADGFFKPKKLAFGSANYEYGAVETFWFCSEVSTAYPSVNFRKSTTGLLVSAFWSHIFGISQ